MNNKYEGLKYLRNNKFLNQREFAKAINVSLGTANSILKTYKEAGLIDSENRLNEKGVEVLKRYNVKRAVILAAGHGLRMMPICRDIPKAFLEINGEILIERLLNQLHEVGITEIYIVVGYMKESFEYLMDKYSVELIVNKDFYEKNNLHSLNLASDKLNNCYIIPSDVYFKSNPFSDIELYSWYMLSDKLSENSHMKVNKKREISLTTTSEPGNKEIGLAYIDSETTKKLISGVLSLKNTDRYNTAFWETASFEKKKCILFAKTVASDDYYEINTYEDLLHADADSKSLDSEYIKIICDALNVDRHDFFNIESLKAGMTNKSFLFNCKGEKYIFRIPGEGTDQLINRQDEYNVYQQIKDKNICDDIIYINPANGYKITRFIENSHNCDPFNPNEVERCMKVLRDFHSMKLKVNHTFDIFEHIDYYEKLMNGVSIYPDYGKTKANVMSLKEFLDSQEIEYSLTHIDAVPDNFVIFDEGIKLIDWEYAAMQDPHVDIAMFCIYAMYDKPHVDKLIDTYFDNACDEYTRAKIYCYIAMCGLLWSNWCEYKAALGVTFGEYSLRQYRYAKDYYKYAKEMMNRLSESEDF